jgi:hypothetical protein
VAPASGGPAPPLLRRYVAASPRIEGAIIAVECWNQSGAAHSFFLCELKKHAEGELLEKAPIQAGKKSKKTDNGEQRAAAANSKKRPTVCSTALYPGHHVAGGVASRTALFLKQEEVVLVNGRGFRYRLAGAVQREYRLVPSALEAILGTTYAQA